MSNQTSKALDEAKKAASEAKQKLQQRVQETLNTLADKIPDEIGRVGKQIAKEYPDVTKQLGRDGVQNLKSALADQGALLANHIRNGAGEISWPYATVSRLGSAFADQGFRSIDPSMEDIKSEVRYYIGKHTDALSNIFIDHGYPDPSPISYVLPQQLFSAADLQPVLEALEELGRAMADEENAQLADDHATVEDLWS